MTIEEKIAEEAMIYISNDINLRSADYNQKVFIESYFIAGAKSERNKTLDEVKAALDRELGLDELGCYLRYEEIIDSLKVNP